MNGSNLSSQKRTTSLWLTPGARVKCGVNLWIVLTCDRYMLGTSQLCHTKMIQTVEASMRSRSLNLAKTTKNREKRKTRCPTLQMVYAVLTSRTPQPSAISTSRFHRPPAGGSVRSPVPAVFKRAHCWNASTNPPRDLVPWNVHQVVGPERFHLDHNWCPHLASHTFLLPWIHIILRLLYGWSGLFQSDEYIAESSLLHTDVHRLDKSARKSVTGIRHSDSNETMVWKGVEWWT